MGTLLPRVIKSSPLLASTAELRFSSALPAAALFGLLYTAERDRYPQVQQLPAASLPEQFVKADPNLQFQPHYRIQSAKGGPAIQLGPRVISVNAETGAQHIDVAYIEGELSRLLEVFDGFQVITSYDRLGLRYINFFEGQNVAERSTFKFSLEDMDLQQHEINLRVQIPEGEFKAGLNFMSHAQVAVGLQLQLTTTAPPDAKRGSLIDIDVFAEPLVLSGESRPRQLATKLVAAHDVAKRLFFKTLTDDFIRELGPEG